MLNRVSGYLIIFHSSSLIYIKINLRLRFPCPVAGIFLFLAFGKILEKSFSSLTAWVGESRTHNRLYPTVNPVKSL